MLPKFTKESVARRELVSCELKTFQNVVNLTIKNYFEKSKVLKGLYDVFGFDYMKERLTGWF